MKFSAYVLLALSVAFLETSAGLAQQAASPSVEQAAPVAAVPPPASPAPPVVAAPAEAPSFAPVPGGHTRSLKKVAPAPAAASKPDPGTPDVVVGGLPGNEAATAVEKQP